MKFNSLLIVVSFFAASTGVIQARHHAHYGCTAYLNNCHRPTAHYLNTETVKWRASNPGESYEFMY